MRWNSKHVYVSTTLTPLAQHISLKMVNRLTKSLRNELCVYTYIMTGYSFPKHPPARAANKSLLLTPAQSTCSLYCIYTRRTLVTVSGREIWCDFDFWLLASTSHLYGRVAEWLWDLSSNLTMVDLSGRLLLDYIKFRKYQKTIPRVNSNYVSEISEAVDGFEPASLVQKIRLCGLSKDL